MATVETTSDDTQSKYAAMESIENTLMRLPEPELSLAVIGINVYAEIGKVPSFDEVLEIAGKKGVPLR